LCISPKRKNKNKSLTCNSVFLLSFPYFDKIELYSSPINGKQNGCKNLQLFQQFLQSFSIEFEHLIYVQIPSSICPKSVFEVANKSDVKVMKHFFFVTDGGTK